MAKQHRLRLFAGPNGSGKSTIKKKIVEELGLEKMGVIIDPDDIESDIRKELLFDFRKYEIKLSRDEITSGLYQSSVLVNQSLLEEIPRLVINDNIIHFDGVTLNSYYASAISEMISNQLIKSRQSFSIESVMSHISKIDLLTTAQKFEYRTYLYYVATDDPNVNIERVRNRVLEGGHNVDEDKIRQRYVRSIELLRQAINFTNRAYVFDNSDKVCILMIEITDGKTWEIKSDFIHPWFSQTYEYLVKRSISMG